MDRVLELWRSCCGDRRPSLLLHCCCGPCSGSVLELLTENFDVTVFWYNPNLYPEAEFELRLETLKELIGRMGLADRVGFIGTDYRSVDYRSAVRGLEEEPEGGARCASCFRLRLEETAKTAREEGFDFFCSTLTVSRHKDAVLINALGEKAAEHCGGTTAGRIFRAEAERLAALRKGQGSAESVWSDALFSGPVWLPSEFKKRGGENRSQELAEKFGLYRQVYCGCEFSYNKRTDCDAGPSVKRK